MEEKTVVLVQSSELKIGRIYMDCTPLEGTPTLLRHTGSNHAIDSFRVMGENNRGYDLSCNDMVHFVKEHNPDYYIYG